MKKELREELISSTYNLPHQMITRMSQKLTEIELTICNFRIYIWVEKAVSCYNLLEVVNFQLL